MTPEQEQHLQDVKEWFTDQVDIKYRAGQREHGGNLWTKPNLPFIMEETIDLVVYAVTMEQNIWDAVEALGNAAKTGDWALVDHVRHELLKQLKPSCE